MSRTARQVSLALMLLCGTCAAPCTVDHFHNRVGLRGAGNACDFVAAIVYDTALTWEGVTAHYRAASVSPVRRTDPYRPSLRVEVEVLPIALGGRSIDLRVPLGAEHRYAVGTIAPPGPAPGTARRYLVVASDRAYARGLDPFCS